MIAGKHLFRLLYITAKIHRFEMKLCIFKKGTNPNVVLAVCVHSYPGGSRGLEFEL